MKISKKIKYNIITFFGAITLVGTINYFVVNNRNKKFEVFFNKEIKSNITYLYQDRSGTHLRGANTEEYVFVPLDKGKNIVRNVQVGDSIIKEANNNSFMIKKKDGSLIFYNFITKESFFWGLYE
jgi:hypothetical protein